MFDVAKDFEQLQQLHTFRGFKSGSRGRGALTGRPRRSQSHCQAAPSPLLLSTSLEVAPRWKLEAGTAADLSQLQEVPLWALVTALQPPDTLKYTKEMHD